MTHFKDDDEGRRFEMALGSLRCDEIFNSPPASSRMSTPMLRERDYQVWFRLLYTRYWMWS